VHLQLIGRLISDSSKGIANSLPQKKNLNDFAIEDLEMLHLGELLAPEELFALNECRRYSVSSRADAGAFYAKLVTMSMTRFS
jgi:hypothetical protein